MAEPQLETPDPLDAAVQQAIAACDGDVRAALRAALVANAFLEAPVEELSRAVSFGFLRGRNLGFSTSPLHTAGIDRSHAGASGKIRTSDTKIRSRDPSRIARAATGATLATSASSPELHSALHSRPSP
jgi:hypothetical protein